jgi:sugar phosphate permease
MATNYEKKNSSFEGNVEAFDASSSDKGFSAERTRVLLRKLDWNIIPFLSLLYLLSFLDRTNVGNARLANLEADLHMSGLNYNVALAIFFPFYVAAEIPSNMMLKRSRPSFWFSFIMICWGITITLMGLVKNYTQLLVVRSILGFTEGGLFPGVTFYITMWYCRREVGLRMALFFSAATAAGAFGGLLARGITELNGKGGLSGWSWIFVIEGLATCIVAIIAFFVIHDYPETAGFLTEEERTEISRRLKADRSSLADEFDMKYFFQAIKDWKIYVHMMITIGIYISLYSFSLFLPTIIKNMGVFTNEQSQLMTVPPYICACLCTIAGGVLADRRGERGIFMIGFCCTALVGFTMLIASSTPAVQYIGTIFAACGIYPNVPLGVAWNSNNIGGSTKRGVGIAMHVGWGNLGGAIGAFLFQTKDAPRFFPGYAALIATTFMALCLCVFMTFWLRGENARRDAIAAENGWGAPETYSQDRLDAERERGDDATFFRYTV